MANTNADKRHEEKAQKGGRLIKYMGISHVRDINQGDTFGGQYPSGLESYLRWDLEDGHLINTADYPDVPAEVWDLVLEEGDFVDATGRKTMPVGEAEKLWLGRRDNPNLVAPTGVAGDSGPSGSGPSAFGNVSGTPAATGSGSGVTGDASTV